MSEFVTKQIVTAEVLAQDLVTKLRERSEEGQSMVEYALLLAFISMAVIGAMKYLQPHISRTLNNVARSL
jgi:Flp pilus assembly pilin Flp